MNANLHFFHIGAVKSGSTSVFHYLNQHPEIEMTHKNWTRFFHVDGADPDIPKLCFENNAVYLQNESIIRARLMIHGGVSRSFEDYKQQWANCSRVYKGEVSPTYLYDETALRNIRRRFPDSKILIVIRNPIERAISHFTMDKAMGWVPEKDFLHALSKEPVHIDNFWVGLRHYLRHGLYARHIRKLLNIFPKNQLKITLYDTLESDQNAFFLELSDFVGFKHFTFDTRQRHNQAPILKPALSTAEYARIRKFFEDDIRETELLTQLKLSHWLAV